MTIIPWRRNVQSKGTLTHAANAGVKGGHWATVLDRAIAEFNRPMSQHELKLALGKVEEGTWCSLPTAARRCRPSGSGRRRSPISRRLGPVYNHKTIFLIMEL